MLLGKYQVIIILVFFVTQSVSVISAVNITAFMAFYKDIFFSYILFFFGLLLINSKQRLFMIIHVIFFSVLVNVLFQFVIYFKPMPFYEILSLLANDKYWNVVTTNADRGKYFIEVYTISFLPILLYFVFLQKKLLMKIIYFLTIIASVFFAFVSEFRTHILVLVFGVISSAVMYVFQFRKKIFSDELRLQTAAVIVLSVFLVLILSNSHMLGITNSSIERIVYPEAGDVTSLETRFWMWQQAYDMSLAYPFFGVGLGNYYDNLYLPSNVSISIFEWRNRLREITLIDPHNIFFKILSETGFVGLISFIVLLCSFLYYDSKLLLNKQLRLSHYLICSFWSFVLYVLFNPSVTIQFLSSFWLLRVLIIQTNNLYQGND